MKIRIIYTYNLRNDEHFQFHTEVKDLIKSQEKLIPKIQKALDAYLLCYDNENEAFKKITKSPLTKDIEAADQRRDFVFTGMVRVNRAALTHFSPDIAAAAYRLKVVFDTYGNLAAKPLHEETSAIYNLLEELQVESRKKDVEQVQLSSWLSELAKENNAFESLVRKRNDEQASKTQLRVKATRFEVDRAYALLIERINALIIVDDEVDYTDFVNKINNWIDKYNQIIAQRQGRNAAKEEEDNVE